MSQQGNYYGSEAIQRQLAEAKEALKDNPKAMKAFAIVENLIGTAGLIGEHVKLIAVKKKRIFRKRDRATKKFKKADKAKKLLMNNIQIRMSMMQHEMIKAQPISKLPKGQYISMNKHEGGSLVVGRGEERIINPVKL